MKNVLLTILLVVFATSINLKAGPTVTGDNLLCEVPSGDIRYTVSSFGEYRFDIYVTGGAINGNTASGFNFDGACANGAGPGIELPTPLAHYFYATYPLYDPSTETSYNNCGLEVSFDVTWDASATTRSIRAVGKNSGTTIYNIFVHDSDNAYISGPGNFVCQSFSGGTFYANSITYPADLSWSATSTGASLSIYSPTGYQTYISGFTPNNMYTINCDISCEGTFQKNISYMVVTGNSCRQEGEVEIIRMEEIARSPGTKPNRGAQDLPDWEGDPATGHIPLPTEVGAGQLQLYPNPVGRSRHLDINIPAQLKFDRLLIYDANGRLLRNLNIKDRTTYRLATGDWPAGLYMAQFSGEAVRETRRFMVTE